MRLKVQVIENGVARDVFFDSAREMICVRDIFPGELEAMSRAAMNGAPLLFAPEHLVRKANRALLDQFVKDWPIQFYAGTHTAPTGVLLDANGHLIEKKGS